MDRKLTNQRAVTKAVKQPGHNAYFYWFLLTFQLAAKIPLKSHKVESLKSGPWQCVLFLIPRSFLDGGALNYSTAPHRSKTTLISNGVFCLLESKILSIGQTLLYSLASNESVFFWHFNKSYTKIVDQKRAPNLCPKIVSRRLKLTWHSGRQREFLSIRGI
jgi:hypothetical protein